MDTGGTRPAFRYPVGDTEQPANYLFGHFEGLLEDVAFRRSVKL